MALTIVFFGFATMNAQLDTLKYLKQFEANKANYINKPFSVLLETMTQIQPDMAWSFSMRQQKNISADTRFKFSIKELIYNHPITLFIEWQEPLPRAETKLLEQKNSFLFTPDEKKYYGTKIVKDIIVYR